MQLVINIPEDIYKASQIIDVKYEDVIQIPLEVIKNGTPLPKGHGRLIDADRIEIMGLVDESKVFEDSVEGYLKAEEVFERIKKYHYATNHV